MKAKSIFGKTTSEIKKTFENVVEDGFSPTLAFVFLSIKHDRNTIRDLLNSHNVDIIGVTSCGEFINDRQENEAISILLLEINRDFYRIHFEKIDNSSINETIANLSKAAKSNFSNPAFIFCSTSFNSQGEMLNGAAMITAMKKSMGKDVNIYGGMAGADFTFGATFVFTNEKETDSGIISLILDENAVEVEGMAISGWQPMGVFRTVTKSDGRLLYTLDDKPAMEMYMKYLGNYVPAGEEKSKIFEEIGAHYPFQVERDSGAPAMITPLEANAKKNALLLESNVEKGARLRFSLPPDFDIVEEVLEKAKNLKKSTQLNPDALLIFSCAGRLSTMGPLAYEENQGLGKLWNAPMAGFYSYGEYGKAIDSDPEFHSTTCCWVALKEK
jgi:hypothetical protein